MIDVVVIGAGPAGVLAALRAAELGAHTVLVAREEFGGMAANDGPVQPLIHDLPFGGVGNSGIGKYHGEWGFRTYTNARGVLYHGTRIDPDLRYPSYSSQNIAPDGKRRKTGR